MLQIPLQAIPAQRLRVVLADQNVTLSLYWRFGALYADMRVDATPVFTGSICQNGANIVQSPSIDFSGSLHFWDTQGAEPPVWSGLGTRWVLLYVPAGEGLPTGLQF